MSAGTQHIGRYRIERTIGRGAMGEIYRAHDPVIDRTVAIKLIHADLLHGDERDAFTARFQREAQAAARCAHPNIVAVYDFALHEGNPFLAMEFVDGMSLAELRGRNGGAASAETGMAPAETATIVLQVLAALGAAHAMGIVHRDIKPANIMLTRAGSVKVADFGISRLDASALTSSGMVVGTPSYMSPEQCRGDPVDGRSDLFSVGIVLYELLAGTKPFAARSAGDLYARLLHEEAPDLSLARPDLSPALCAVVARSLAKDPAARFASAHAMASALRAATGAPAASADVTIVLPARAADPETAPAPGAFDREMLERLERKLAEHVGPIARHLVQSAVRKADTVEDLCASLAARIEPQEARDRFEREVKAQMRASSTASRSAPSGLVLSPTELERVQTALARHLGPVARILIKRALPGASTPGALWHGLAEHIEPPADRAAFLRDAPP